MSAEFFFNRMQRAIVMDSTNKILGKDCAYIRDAIEWRDAFVSQLTAGKQKEFDKDWNKLDKSLEQSRIKK